MECASPTSEFFEVEWKNQAVDFLKGFRNLLKSKKILKPEVTITCVGGFVKCHKIVLTMSSAYFRDIFQNIEVDAKTVVLLPGVSVNVFRHLYNFMLCGKIRLPTHHADDFYNVGKQLQLEGLKDVLIQPTVPSDTDCLDKHTDTKSVGHASTSYGETVNDGTFSNTQVELQSKNELFVSPIKLRSTSSTQNQQKQASTHTVSPQLSKLDIRPNLTLPINNRSTTDSSGLMHDIQQIIDLPTNVIETLPEDCQKDLDINADSYAETDRQMAKGRTRLINSDIAHNQGINLGFLSIPYDSMEGRQSNNDLSTPESAVSIIPLQNRNPMSALSSLTLKNLGGSTNLKFRKKQMGSPYLSSLSNISKRQQKVANNGGKKIFSSIESKSTLVQCEMCGESTMLSNLHQHQLQQCKR